MKPFLAAVMADGEVGTEQAFEEALVAHRTRLLRGAVLLVGTREDAEDLTQKAMLKAWRGRAQFRGQSRFYTWLYRILMNLAKDHYKARARSDRWLDEFASSRDDTSTAPAGEEQLLDAERDEVTRRALAQLAENHRQVLVLRHYEELSYSEIAEVLACPIGTVRSRLNAARAQFRQRLQALRTGVTAGGK